MRKAIWVLCSLVMVLSFAGVTNAVVINFDNIPGARPDSVENEIPEGYGGFDWSQFYVIHQSKYPGSGYASGVTSGEWAAYNSWDNAAFISDGNFNFAGAFFTSAWDSTNNLSISGYRNGESIFNAVVTLNKLSPVWFQADWVGIDKLEFSTDLRQFVMDDFTFSVPEPGTILFFSIILLSLAVVLGAHDNAQKKGAAL